MVTSNDCVTASTDQNTWHACIYVVHVCMYDCEKLLHNVCRALLRASQDRALCIHVVQYLQIATEGPEGLPYTLVLLETK